MNTPTSSFPPGFTWGAATSAYQIEGAWDADGKGPSVWDAFCHQRVPAGSTGNIPGQVYTPGNVYMGQTGDTAADHYHRFHDDVGLMKQIGLRAYRFSISWPRVMPSDPTTINPKGLDFYSRLVDALLESNVNPWATLFHWDLPLWAAHRGGWLNRDIQHWFADYTRAVVDRLSDRLTHWITINEPQIFLGPSEHEGTQTTNARWPHSQRLLAAHNCLLAHGRAAQIIRSSAKKAPQIGWAPIGRVKVPWSAPLSTPAPDGRMLSEPSPENIAAARAATNATLYKDFWTNAWFADPVVFGTYPVDGLALYGNDAPPEVRSPRDGDMATIKQPLDFYGINVYDAELFRACAPYPSNPCGPSAPFEKVDFPAGWPRTAIGWFILPEALYYGAKFLYDRYKLPIAITENGLSNTDWVATDGAVHDPQRIDYTRRYLLQLNRAMGEGAKVAGYFHWSLMDNMEWQNGYKDRFGLIHVDFQTQKRTLKDSAHWYAKVIASNGASLAAQ